MITARKLQPDEIPTAKRLLYDVYTGDLNWHPPADNPSMWRTSQLDGEPVFTDRFEEVSEWFGAFAAGLLVGAVRLITPLQNMLEIEYYYDIPKSLRQLGPAAEMNRMVIRDHQKNAAAIIPLFQVCIETLLARKTASLFVATTIPSPTDFLLKIGFEAHGNFRYAADDAEVCLLHLNTNDHTKIEGIIATCLQLRAA